MTSRELIRREYHDGKLLYKRGAMVVSGNVPSYYLMKNEPDMFDDSNVKTNYSIIAIYTDGNINQWFYDDIKSAFRIFRILTVGRNM